MPSIKLQSKDGEVFQIDTDAAKLSVTIRDMMELLGIEEGSEDPVPLGEVNAQTLNRVIQWCTHHKNDPVPTEEDESKEKELKTDDIPSWDNEFLKIDQELLFELIRAANYLHVKGLLDVCCKTVANMIKGQISGEAIRKMFNIKNDFTAEEEEQVRKENEWCQEK